MPPIQIDSKDDEGRESSHEGLVFPVAYELHACKQTALDRASLALGLTAVASQLAHNATFVRSFLNGLSSFVATAPDEEFQRVAALIVPADCVASDQDGKAQRASGRRFGLSAASLEILADACGCKGSERSFFELAKALGDPTSDLARLLDWAWRIAARPRKPLGPPRGQATTMNPLLAFFTLHEQETRAQAGPNGLRLALGSVIVLRVLVRASQDHESLGPGHSQNLRDDESLPDLVLDVLRDEQRERRKTDEKIPDCIAQLRLLTDKEPQTGPGVLAIPFGRVGLSLTAPWPFLHQIVRHQLIVLARRTVSFDDYLRLNRGTISAIDAIQPASLRQELAGIAESLPALARTLLSDSVAVGYGLPTPEDLKTFAMFNAATMGSTVIVEEDFHPAIDVAVSRLLEELQGRDEGFSSRATMVHASALGSLGKHGLAEEFWKAKGNSASALVEAYMPHEASLAMRRAIWSSFAKHCPDQAKLHAGRLAAR